ncbi:stage II sporulation protein M [Halorarum halobium]|uniref:stage II sporulation protein M n=1 Tax=Halorarum halobium TaxID=3075121 RepID=UPI0028A70154|nr:stage II sporulation protein M [Halobaculum sp. XH14]
MSTDRSPSLSDAFTGAGRVLADHPVAVVSAYLLVVAVVPIARVPFLVALTAAVGVLAAAGRIEPVVQALAEQASISEDGGLGGGGIGEGGIGGGFGGGDPPISPELERAVEGLFVPEVGLLLVAGVLLTVVVAVLVGAVATAVSTGTVWAALDGRPPLEDGVATAGRWPTFLGVTLVRAVAVLVPVAVPVALTLGIATLAGGIGVSVGVAVGALLVLAGALVSLLVYLLLVFAEAAVVVDGAGTVEAVRGSLGFVRRNVLATVVFALVALGVYVGASVAVGLLNLVGVNRLGALVLSLTVAPLLDAFAVALYAETGLPAADRAPLGTRVRGALADGWSALWRFVREHPAANAAGALLLTGGAVAGYLFTAPMGVTLPPPENVATVFGVVPVGPFLNIAANNWLVSAGTAFGGLAAGVPAAASLLFNGVLIGALGGIFDRVAFLALVAPHGVIELPAIAVAGGLGVHLGVVGWRGARGRSDAGTVAAELRRATWVLVGLALVLVVASFVEAFLTPRIAAFVLG